MKTTNKILIPVCVISILMLISSLIIFLACGGSAGEDLSRTAFAGQREDKVDTGDNEQKEENVDKKLWIYYAKADIYSSPAVESGCVYFGAGGDSGVGYMYSLDAVTGALKWELQLPGGVQSSPVISTQRGVLYVGCNDNKLYCLFLTTAFNPWAYAAAGKIKSSPALNSDGDVIFGCDDGKVYCIDDASGQWIWEFNTGKSFESTPAIVNGNVYIGCSDGKVYCLNATTGVKAWEFNANSPITSSPAVLSDSLFVASNASFFALNANTGAALWDFAQKFGSSCAPAIENTRVFIPLTDKNLYSIDTANGSQVWSYQYAEIQTTPYSAAIASGYIYFGCSNRLVLCVDSNNNGQKVWSYGAVDGLLTAPAVVNGKLYIGGLSKAFYCLNAEEALESWPMFKFDTSRPGGRQIVRGGNTVKK